MTFLEVLVVSLLVCALDDRPSSPPTLAVQPQREPELQAALVV